MPSNEPLHDGLSRLAPVHQVWFGNGRPGGLSGPHALFPICKDHKATLVPNSACHV